MACAVIALVVANSPLAGAYFGMLHVHVATCVDRLAGDGGHTVSIEVDEVDTKRLHRVDVQDDKGASPT